MTQNNVVLDPVDFHCIYQNSYKIPQNGMFHRRKKVTGLEQYEGGLMMSEF